MKKRTIVKSVPSVLMEAIRKEVRRLLAEDGEDLFGDEEQGQDQQQTQQAQPDGRGGQNPATGQGGDQTRNPGTATSDNKVSLGKVSGTGNGGSSKDVEPTLDNVVEKLNSIRSGRSFKDDQIMAQMEKYFGELKTAEKKALLAFLSGISQITTGGVEGTQADEPKDPPHDVQMIDKGAQNAKHVKPNVVKKGGALAQKPAENTAPPVNVKQR